MLTVERLREVLDYNSDTGIFVWCCSMWSNVKAGDVAGSTNKKGYIVIGIDGVTYYAQRLAWLYVKGEWPPSGIDHEDLNPSHNWFSNLREATQGQNLKNVPRHKDNQSGFKGVIFDKARGKFRAEIMTDGKRKYLGRFNTALAAHAAYSAASMQQHGEFGRAV